MTFTQQGGNVIVSTNGGSLDTTGLTISGPDGSTDVFTGNGGWVGASASPDLVNFSNVGVTVTDSANWTQNGLNVVPTASSGTGGLYVNSDGEFCIDFGSIVGVNTNGAYSATVANSTLANLGLTANSSMTLSWVTDSITMNVSAVPEPSSAILLGLGALGLVSRRTRK